MLKELLHQRTQAQAELKRLKKRAKQAKKQRKKQKNKLMRAGKVDPKLLPRDLVGRPRLTSEQSGLLQAIIDVATADQNKLAADPRRRSEQIKSYMRLDDLVKALSAKGFKISRSATHLNDETVPVRICRAQNDHYDRHEDVDFCFSLAEDLNVLCSILGEEAVIISPDDKAIVKLGVVAAKMQTAIVMHL